MACITGCRAASSARGTQAASIWRARRSCSAGGSVGARHRRRLHARGHLRVGDVDLERQRVAGHQRRAHLRAGERPVELADVDACRTGRSAAVARDAPEQAAVACRARRGLQLLRRRRLGLRRAGGRRLAPAPTAAHARPSTPSSTTPQARSPIASSRRLQPQHAVALREAHLRQHVHAQQRRGRAAAARPRAAARHARRPAAPRRRAPALPCTTPPAVDDCSVPSGASPARSASACGIAVPVAPVSTRKSTAMPLTVPGQWKWPSAPRRSSIAPVTASTEKRARCRATARPARRRTRAVPSSSQTITSLKVCGNSRGSLMRDDAMNVPQGLRTTASPRAATARPARRRRRHCAA